MTASGKLALACLGLMVVGFCSAGTGKQSGAAGDGGDLMAEALRAIKAASDGAGGLEKLQKNLEQMLLAKEKVNPAAGTKESDGVSSMETQLREQSSLAFLKTLSKPVKGMNEAALRFIARIPMAEGGGDLTDHLLSLSEILGRVDSTAVAERLEKSLMDAGPENVGSWTPELLEAAVKEAASEGGVGTSPAARSGQGGGLLEVLKAYIGYARMRPQESVDNVLTFLGSYQLVSKKTIKFAKVYSQNFVEGEAFSGLLDAVEGFLDAFLDSAGGQRLLDFLPKLASAKDQEDVFRMIAEEAESSWAAFNEGGAESSSVFLEQVASAVGGFYRNVVKDDMKLLMANAFLISQGLPTLRSDSIIDSSAKLISKGFELFTTNYESGPAEVKATAEKVKRAVAQLEKEYSITVKQFDKMSPEEQTRLIVRFLQDKVVVTAKDLWQVHFRISMGTSDDRKSMAPSCVNHILCRINSKQAGNDVGQMVTQYLSTWVSLLWAKHDEKLGADAMADAISKGTNPHNNCDVLFPADKKCRSLADQASGKAGIHQEL